MRVDERVECVPARGGQPPLVLAPRDAELARRSRRARPRRGTSAAAPWPPWATAARASGPPPPAAARGLGARRGRRRPRRRVTAARWPARAAAPLDAPAPAHGDGAARRGRRATAPAARTRPRARDPRAGGDRRPAAAAPRRRCPRNPRASGGRGTGPEPGDQRRALAREALERSGRREPSHLFLRRQPPARFALRCPARACSGRSSSPPLRTMFSPVGDASAKRSVKAVQDAQAVLRHHCTKAASPVAERSTGYYGDCPRPRSEGKGWRPCVLAPVPACWPVDGCRCRRREFTPGGQRGLLWRVAQHRRPARTLPAGMS